MNWYRNIWRPRSFVIVFIEFVDDHIRLYAVKASVNDSLSVEDPNKFDSLSEIVSFFGNSIGYLFHVEGKGVLSKKIQSKPTFQENLIISGNQEEFNFTWFDDSSSIAVSFFRKDLISAQIDESQRLKIHLLGITSGLIPLFGLTEDNFTIQLSYSLTKNQGKIIEFKQNETKRSCMYLNRIFTKHQILGHGIIESYSRKNAIIKTSYEDEGRRANENYIQFNQFKVYGVTLVTLIFLSLLINYFYQNSLNDQLAKLEMELSISNDNLSLLERLEQEKVRKERLIVNAGVNSSKFHSYYLDEIGNTIPHDISLQKLTLFPVKGKLKNKEKVEINQHQIILVGQTVGNEVLDNWIEKIDRFGWVESIELLNYAKHTLQNSEFTIIIKLKD